jgi:hypothetical protein
MGLYSNNLTKSYLYHTLYNFNSAQPLRSGLVKVLGRKQVKSYLRPIQLLNFAFQKTMYNTLIFFIVYILVELYITPQTCFDLNYGFIFIKRSIYACMFANKFYFKVRNL